MKTKETGKYEYTSAKNRVECPRDGPGAAQIISEADGLDDCDE